MITEGKPLHIILKETMNEHGLKLTAWPRKAGLSPNILRNYFEKIANGENASLTYKVIDKLAGVIEMTGSELLGNGVSSPQIAVKGYVQAGTFAEEHLIEIEKYETIPERLIGTPKLTALEVRGDSMDMVFPESSIIFCQECEHYLAQGGKLDNQRFVIVVRSQNNQREYTVKRLQINEDGSISLLPVSSNALHRPITFQPDEHMLGPDFNNNDIMVQITGVVLGAHTVFQ